MTNMERVGSALIGFLAATVIALMTAWAAAAQDEEKPRWFGTTDGDTATLVYGVPNSDYVMLYFSCTIGKPVVTVHVQDEESRAKEGALLRVRLSAGAARIEFSEKAIPNEDSGGKDVEGHLPLDDTLRRILTAKDTLEIVVDGHKQRYAMEGAAKPAAAMLAACSSLKQTGNLDVTVTNKVPASFDCAKAGKAVEKFICSQAVLRWQDLALSRSYRAARNAVTGAARDDLLAGQRDWVRERDRHCVADRTFKELSAPSSALRTQAYVCLNSVYISRRRALQDLAAAPLSLRGIEEIDLKPIEAARPEIVDETGPRIAGIKASPDGSMLAILLPSLEIDYPDQIWLYRVADHKLVVATPKPDQSQPHPDGSLAAIKSLAWQGDTLYARVAIWSKSGEGEEGTTVVYSATIAGSNRLDDVPGDIYALLDDAGQLGVVGQDEVSETDWDILETIRANRDFLVWPYDLGHGTVELRMRKRVAGSSTFLVAWGSRSLWQYLFDADRSQLIYAADTGVSVFDMTTHGERRIVGTSAGDQPHAISVDHSLFVWSTRNRCGDKFLAGQDESKPQRLCLARLSKPEAGK
jgi:uncharacterized protein YecT (DUF1311 family)